MLSRRDLPPLDPPRRQPSAAGAHRASPHAARRRASTPSARGRRATKTSSHGAVCKPFAPPRRRRRGERGVGAAARVGGERRRPRARRGRSYARCTFGSPRRARRSAAAVACRSARRLRGRRDGGATLRRALHGGGCPRARRRRIASARRGAARQRGGRAHRAVARVGSACPFGDVAGVCAVPLRFETVQKRGGARRDVGQRARAPNVRCDRSDDGVGVPRGRPGSRRLQRTVVRVDGAEVSAAASRARRRRRAPGSGPPRRVMMAQRRGLHAAFDERATPLRHSFYPLPSPSRRARRRRAGRSRPPRLGGGRHDPAARASSATNATRSRTCRASSAHRRGAAAASRTTTARRARAHAGMGQRAVASRVEISLNGVDGGRRVRTPPPGGANDDSRVPPRAIARGLEWRVAAPPRRLEQMQCR